MDNSMDNTSLQLTASPGGYLSDEAAQALIQILDASCHCYQDVAAAMVEKKEKIIIGKTDELLRVDQQLLTLQQQAQTLEEERLELFSQAQCQDLSLEEIIQSLQGPVRQRLTEQRQILLRLVKNVETLNKENRRLLNHSVDWIAKAVETVVGAVAPEGSAYTAKGNKTSTGHTTNPQGEKALRYTPSTVDRRI